MLIGQSCIIAPTGELVAMASTLEDEVITAVGDLDRRPEHYGPITALPAR